MGVLFLMPTWASPSELWMRRMLATLADRLAGVACYRPGETTFAGRPCVDLIDRERSVEVVREAIRTLRPSSILIHYLPFALRLMPAWRESGVPTFVHAHGYDVTWDGRRHEPPHEKRFDEGYPTRVVEMSRSAMIFANSNATRAKIESIGVGGERIIVKHLGVPLPKRIERSTGGPTRVLFLGRLVDFKGPALTIDAFARAVRLGMDGVLTIAGDGPMRGECESAIERSGVADRIELSGEVDADTGERLRRESHMFTAHSMRGPMSRQEEAFGVSFAEAMASELPVMTGRNGSLPELIDDGVEGVLFEPGDVESHARAMVELSNDESKRRRMGEAGRAKVAAKFTLEHEAAILRRWLK